MVLKTDRLSYEDLQSRLLAIPNSKHQAFLCLTYAALGRVGEITKHVKMPLFHVKKNKRGPGIKQIKNKQYDNPPVSKEQIRFDEAKQKIYIDLMTEKTQIRRTVPVSTKERDVTGPFPWGEKWLTSIIQNYVSACPTNELFPYTTRWGEKVFQKYFPEFGEHIHLLRSWRATHLLAGKVTGQLILRQTIQRMGGWKSISTLDKVYDQSIVEDYENML